MSMLKTLVEKRAAVQAEIDAIVGKAETEARDFTETESAEFDSKIAEARSLDERIAQMEAADEARSKAAAASAKLPSSSTSVKDPEVYRSGGENSYFRDLALASVRNDRDAIDRLVRNDKIVKEARAINTTDGTGGDFVPPLYLTDQWIRFARAGRVTADQVTKQGLPAGTDSINMPKVASGTETGVQASQGSAITNVDMSTSTVTAPVVTIAGGQTVSLQLLEQSPVNMDQIILQDLAADYAKRLDLQVLSGTGTNGQMKGLLTITNTNSVTYTSTAPTAALLYSKIADAVQQVHTNRFLPATHIFMHPRRWAALLAASDSAGRPLVVPVAGGPFNAMAGGVEVAAEGMVGTLQGIPVYLDANIPTNLGAATNEDRIIVARAADSYLWEATPRAEALPQTYGANLQVLVRFYNYAAFTGERYSKSVSVIGGTGLVAPTF